jgi:hypothetical protein
LAVVSAHAQDAVVRVADMAYLPREKRFAALINRFDWTTAVAGSRDSQGFARCRSALRFDRVLGAQVQGIDLGQRASVLNLLAISYEPTTEPEGHVVLLFAGGAAIRLHVECIEGEIRDLGAVWGTKRRPEHPGEAGDA